VSIKLRNDLSLFGRPASDLNPLRIKGCDRRFGVALDRQRLCEKSRERSDRFLGPIWAVYVEGERLIAADSQERPRFVKTGPSSGDCRMDIVSNHRLVLLSRGLRKTPHRTSPSGDGPGAAPARRARQDRLGSRAQPIGQLRFVFLVRHFFAFRFAARVFAGALLQLIVLQAAAPGTAFVLSDDWREIV
jgi:hypothetical protein